MSIDFKTVSQYKLDQLDKEQLEHIQSLLKDAGYQIKVDGILGQETLRQFAAFKEDNYLGDGSSTLGTTTYARLVEEAKSRLSPAKPSKETTDLSDPKRQPKLITIPGYGEVFTTTKISKYFSWGDVTHNGTRIPKSAQLADNAKRLALQLDLLRDQLQKPLYVTSWYRPETVNKAVGGAPKSQHLTCKAVDVWAEGITGHELAKFAKKKLWKGGIGCYKNIPSICHLDIGSPRQWGF